MKRIAIGAIALAVMFGAGVAASAQSARSTVTIVSNDDVLNAYHAAVEKSMADFDAAERRIGHSESAEELKSSREYDAAKEQTEKDYDAAMKPFIEARAKAEKHARKPADKEAILKAAEAEYDAAQSKRLAIWGQYTSGKLPADQAVKQLLALAGK